MENLNTDEIQREMEKTRASLSEKLVDLETQVVGTIQSANDAVAGTVENVKTVVTEAVDSVKESVQTVKGTVADVTESVKETFDVKSKVRENPWLSLGTSLAAGLVTGMYLFGKSSSGDRETRRAASSETAGAVGAASLYEPRPAERPSEKPSWLEELWANMEQQLKHMGQAALDQLGDAVVKEVSQLVPGFLENMKAVRKKRHHEPAHRNGGAKGFSRHAS